MTQDIIVNGLRIDHARRLVWLDGEHIPLTPMEYKIVFRMAQHPEWVVTKEELMQDRWNLAADELVCPECGQSRGSAEEMRNHTRTIDSAMVRLRHKLPGYIHTVWGVGYRLIEPELEVAA